MKRLLLFLLVVATLVLALVTMLNAALYAFAVQGGATFEDWEDEINA